ncbi:MAG: substrate-binding domain-containing protein [Oscillospiraceae bacterium]|nr:substrate-binding domain-containing protein [Oscillospiraceae bacterium]
MQNRLTIGVVTAECYRDYIAEMIGGILAQSELAGCNVIVLAARNNFQEPVSPHVAHEADLFRLLELPVFDGFIYDQNAFAQKEILKKLDGLLKRSGKPVMLLDSRDHPFFENTVSHDPEAFAMLIEHMIQVHGHRKIYCLTGTKGTAQAEDRLASYFHVMQRHGLYYDDSYYAYGDFWRDAPVEYAQRIISGDVAMPEAVVCANDIMADALIAALGKAGIRVPQDMAVTGFDGFLEDAQSNVSLTTYPKSCYQLGSDAFRRLYSIMTGRNCRRIRTKKYTPIRIGHSCGCISGQRPTEKSHREKQLLSRHREWFYHSEVLFELLHQETLYDLLFLVASRIYLVCHWSGFRIFLKDAYLKTVQPEVQRPAHKDLCEVLWTDRAGKSTGITERPLRQSDLIAYLTQCPEHPCAWFLSPLHMDDRQFGYAALSFGRLSCAYQPEYCTLISYINLALDQLQEKYRLRSQQSGRMQNVENPQLYRKLEQLREEMQQRPEEDWSVQVLCWKTNVSRSYLQRIYKRYFGKSIFEELIDFRLQKAKNLLETTDLSIARIAELCGYASYTHFAKQFKAHEGITLSMYREQLWNSKE